MNGKGTKESCMCEVCRGGCYRVPGRFLPGEAEKVTEYLGISLGKLFQKYLRVGYTNFFPSLDDFDDNVFLLSPAVVEDPPGQEHPLVPFGTCVFFENGLCKIHPVKPFQCREAFHDDTGGKDTWKILREAWKDNQKQIEELLGREPKRPL